MRSTNLTGRVVLRPLLNCKEQDDPMLIEAIRFGDHLLGISMKFHTTCIFYKLSSHLLWFKTYPNVHPHCMPSISMRKDFLDPQPSSSWTPSFSSTWSSLSSSPSGRTSWTHQDSENIVLPTLNHAQWQMANLFFLTRFLKTFEQEIFPRYVSIFFDTVFLDEILPRLTSMRDRRVASSLRQVKPMYSSE